MWTRSRGSYTCPQLITPGDPICSYLVRVLRHACIPEHAVGVKERYSTNAPEGLGDWTVNHKGRLWGRCGSLDLIPWTHRPPFCQAGSILLWNSLFQLCRPHPGSSGNPPLGHGFNSQWGGGVPSPPDFLSVLSVSPWVTSLPCEQFLQMRVMFVSWPDPPLEFISSSALDHSTQGAHRQRLAGQGPRCHGHTRWSQKLLNTKDYRSPKSKILWFRIFLTQFLFITNYFKHLKNNRIKTNVLTARF